MQPLLQLLLKINPNFSRFYCNKNLPCSSVLQLTTNYFSAFLDECSSLIGAVSLIKDLKCWCLSTVTNILNINIVFFNIWSVCWLLTAQIPEQTIGVIFLFFSSYTLVIRNIVYCIRSYLNCLKNTYIKPCKWVVFSYLGCLKRKVIAIVIVITFNVIVIDYIVILFIRNRNRACSK